MNFDTFLEGSILQYGLVIVFAGGLMESETILILTGVLCHRGSLPIESAIIAGVLGAFVGDQFWFHIGCRYGENTLHRFPRLEKQAARIKPWLDKKADWVAFGSRFSFGFRTAAPILLGMDNYPRIRFTMFNLISACLWVLAGFSVGYLVGAGTKQLFGWIEQVEQLLVVIVLIMIFKWWYQQRKLRQR